jgi:hypothetical protein
VDLIGTYPNHRNRADLLKRTRRWLSEGRQAPIQDPKVSVRARPEEIVPRRVVDRLGEEAVRELIEAVGIIGWVKVSVHRRKSGELVEPGRRRLVLPRSD